jgi:hypothetical protein
MRRKVLIILAAVLLLAAAAFTTFAFVRRGSPVWLRIEDQGDMVGTPMVLILNPFRDRGAENSAAEFLEQLKLGRCPQVVESLYANSPDYRQYVCGKEASNRLQSWSLADRTETGSTVRLYYWNARRTYDGEEGQLWVTVEKRDAQWRVVNYECWY